MRRTKSRVERTKCCRTESGCFSLCLSPYLHSFLLCKFREARAALRKTRVLPAAPPTYPLSVRLTNRHRHLSPACSVVTDFVLYCVCHLLIYIRLHSRLLPSSCPLVSSVLTGRVPVFLCSFVTGREPLFPFLLSPALRFKNPVVPPRFSTHTLNNATTGA